MRRTTGYALYSFAAVLWTIGLALTIDQILVATLR